MIGLYPELQISDSVSVHNRCRFSVTLFLFLHLMDITDLALQNL